MTRMFLSYMAGTILLVSATFLVIHQYFIAMLAQQMQDNAEDAMHRFQSSLDYQISAMDRIAGILGQDYDMRLRGGLTVYDTYKISQKLRHYAGVNQNLADIFILDETNSVMVSSSGVTNLNDYFYLYHCFQKTDTIPAQILSAKKPLLTAFFNTGSSTVFPGSHSFYVVPGKGGNKYVFTINQKYFVDAVQDLSFGFSGYLYILDEHFKPMSELSLLEKPFLSQNISEIIDQMKTESHIPVQLELGNGIQARMEPSTTHMWNYCVISDNSGLYDRLLGIYFVYFFALGGILAVGLAMNLLISRFNCIPLRRVVQSLLPQREKYPALDDLRLIANAFEDIRSENATLSQRIMEKDENIASQVFRLLLVGAVSGRQAQEELEKVGVRLLSQFCTLSFLSRNDEPPGEIGKIAGQLCAVTNAYPVFSMEVLENGAVAFLINFNRPLKTELLVKTVLALLPDGMSAGIGSIRELDQIPISFRQSLTAAQMAASTQASVLCYEQIQKPFANFYPAISQLRRDLIEALRRIRPDQVEECARRYFSFLQSQPERRHEYYNLCSELFILGEQTGCHCIEGAFHSIESVSAVDMEKELWKLLYALCTDLEAQKASAKKQFKFQVEEYLRQHSSDSMLTVSNVADHFGVSVSYLDRYFKKYFFTTLTVYLDDIRMEQAAALLLTTREKIKYIVEGVGYVDVNNFNRKFKRKYGMTPSQYRASKPVLKEINED